MLFGKLLNTIIRNKKEVYYPLLTINICFFIYLIISLFVIFADSVSVFPFLLITISLLLFQLVFDSYRILKNNKDISQNDLRIVKNKHFKLYTLIPLICFSAGTIELAILLIVETMFIIPIILHSITIIIIYFFLRKEVKRYYLDKKQLKI